MDSAVEDPSLPMDYDQSPWGRYGRSFTLGFVSLMSKFVLNVLNTTHVQNHGNYFEATTKRPPGVGLITVSNHARCVCAHLTFEGFLQGIWEKCNSTIDDPTLHSALLPLSFFLTEHHHGKNRWVTCAEEMCFRNEFLKQFFLTGKTLPVKRGAGVNQPIMGKIAELIKRGDWVHIFPEGRVGYDGALQPLKWGVGKAICDSLKNEESPVVLPFYHCGMSEVMPKKARFPRINKQINILIGKPLNLRHVTCKCHQNDNPQEVWKEITVEIQKALQELEAIAKNNQS